MDSLDDGFVTTPYHMNGETSHEKGINIISYIQSNTMGLSDWALAISLVVKASKLHTHGYVHTYLCMHALGTAE